MATFNYPEETEEQYRESLKSEGKLGCFLSESQLSKQPVYVELDVPKFWSSVNETLTAVISRSLDLNPKFQNLDQTITKQKATNFAAEITNGVCVLTYIKLRTVNFALDFDLGASRFFKKPIVPATFDVPNPLRLLSQGARVLYESPVCRLSRSYAPLFRRLTPPRFACRSDRRWSFQRYSLAVEFAKGIGLKFLTVDLSMKQGTSWWLYRPVVDGGIFRLRCTIPEDNYSEEAAVVRTLFMSSSVDDIAGHEIFDLSSVESHDYGSMLRNPFEDINVSTYLAFEEVAEN